MTTKTTAHKWKVILPGQNQATFVTAATATGALKNVLAQSTGYTYQGVTIGPKKETAHAVYNLLFESEEARVSKVNGPKSAHLD